MYQKKRDIFINFLDLTEMFARKKNVFAVFCSLCSLLDPTAIPPGRIFSVLPAHSISSSVYLSALTK